MIERTTTLPRRLIDYTGSPASVPTQRRIREDAVNGKITAHQVNKIWHYDTADVPAIAAVYGLPPKGPDAGAKSARKASVAPISVAA